MSRLTQLSPKNLDKAFAILEACAVAGERCPITAGPTAHRFLVSGHTSALAKSGRIFIEISGQNFRRITILTGTNKGRSTASNPDTGAHVWQTVGMEGTKINGRLFDHGAHSRPKPSAPRLLSAEELSR